MTDSIGMMEGAFFVSRNDLLNWINDLLKLNITKVEQLGTGAVYCQILDACYPGEVALHRVNWRARLEWEFVNNFKILQQAFLKCKIQKQIDVEKLAKSRHQDNLEFAQWMKRYYEIKYGKDGGRSYDPLARRGKIEPDFSFTEKGSLAKANPIGTGSHHHPLPEIRKTKAKEDLINPQPAKKMKLSLGNTGSTSITVSANVTKGSNKENAIPCELEKLRSEKLALEAKLKYIEELVNSQDKDDAFIVKTIRDCLGCTSSSSGSGASLTTITAPITTQALLTNQELEHSIMDQEENSNNQQGHEQSEQHEQLEQSEQLQQQQILTDNTDSMMMIKPPIVDEQSLMMPMEGESI